MLLIEKKHKKQTKYMKIHGFCEYKIKKNIMCIYSKKPTDHQVMINHKSFFICCCFPFFS